MTSALGTLRTVAGRLAKDIRVRVKVLGQRDMLDVIRVQPYNSEKGLEFEK